MTEIDWTQPITTADGKPARVLATDVPGSHPIVVLIGQATHRYPLSGEPPYGTSPRLVNGPKKYSGYIAVGPLNMQRVTSLCCSTEEDARNNFYSRFNVKISTMLKVEWEE